MPAARPVFKQCTCEECIEKGGRDENGEPKGLPVAECLIAAHIQRVRADRSGRNNAGADLVASRLSALGDTLSVCTVTDNLGHLTLSEDIPDIPTPVEFPVHPELRIPAPPVIVGCFYCKSSQERIDMTGHRRVLQRHNSQQTVKALRLLDNIESRVQRCFFLLSAGSFDAIGRELPLLRKAADNVSQKADMVRSRKDTIISQIDSLGAQFESRKPFTTDSLNPVEFDAGMVTVMTMHLF
ncbi:hypothetical protein DFJ58DRAFT_844715 [Suillus subalutaceus]|uniref:uncharacterized protein n=1 Tax=Suillus subalutaceus TaxID=48586 RepID=UPI001B877126|nr:uncharacterized protein DFJ58DRAFT_844715 [Suillus subalutaceus]KAG1842407.1 hypothetical protein DFJ58DRAFT_844715 [Suillus subalutaceus]